MDFQLPELGEGIYEAELVEWRVKPGDQVQPGQSLAEVLTDKATMDVPSPFAGQIDKLHVDPGNEMKVGQVVLSYTSEAVIESAADDAVDPDTEVERIQPTESHEVVQRSPEKAETETPHHVTATTGVQAAPAVRRMARGLAIDLAAVPGSGPDGRVLINDMTEFIRSSRHTGARSHDGPAREARTRVHADQKPDAPEELKPGTRVKFRGVRRKIARHMVEAKQKIPHFGYVDQCDVTQLVQVRESLKDSYPEVKLTFLPFMVQAAVAALKEYPLVNSRLDERANEIVLHDHYHIGIATDTPLGLIVPVVRHADHKNLIDLAGEIQRLTSAARSGMLAAGDLRGSTFTVTSIGSIGGLFTTPIINHPEVGIMGIGKRFTQPSIDVAGNVHARDMVYLSYSFDHRVVDGAIAARFSNAVIQQLENPTHPSLAT
ncbi:Dihydrolipoyllysine-residue acetyltransferase component of pyruvate dehydrogenase complex [Stieleria maiorica]|uniref:Dihydrolipoamide acetyltransferase component of pyruvate dehydrogenase complex n=1 Tax=Stieleria maiorica TaxID=2795974 RepID=A0A5B9MJX1_9BACT|nr:dihydrolipoamide acetyltransferase family protein [Stieleria maiorica]QEG01572.1 Dihydrolipoyllysine-residue acetyltransferase component of pyruvate dehydrogenase complex [Stieleria maiorica]